ncbi:MAG: HEAT repeat domain-containing protein [Planctomycetes bacterium]|nr:HEAT repeat domain-containing protein [Planctomycetota bacterium]
MILRSALSSAFLLTLLGTASVRADPPPAQPPEDPRRAEFRSLYGQSPLESWHARAVQAINVNDPSALPLLYEVLQEPNGYVRAAAARQLATASAPEARAALREAARNHPEPLVREGVVMTLALAAEPGEEDRATVRQAAARDADWRVRRTAAWGLSLARVPASVDALLEAWLAEEGREGGAQARVQALLVESLRTLCGEDRGATRREWSAWWEGHRAQFQVPQEPGPGPMRRLKVDGVWIDVETPTLRRDPPRPIVYVIPEYGLNASLYRPGLAALAGEADLVYFDLPRVSDFERLDEAREIQFGHPVYPTAALSRALEAFRREQGHGPVVVLAHGVSACVASEFARANPGAVRGLILVSAISGGDAYLRTLLALRTSERLTVEQREHLARRVLRAGEPPLPVTDPEAELRAYFSIYFHDQGDLELAWRCGPCLRNLGQVQFPPFDFKRGAVPDMPVLLAVGAHGVLGTPSDNRKIERAFGRRARIARFERSGRAPFLEEPGAFREAVTGFLRGLE